jgi:hypothetical protein
LVAAVVGGLKRAPEEAGLAEEDEEERSVALMLGLERVMTEPPDSAREYSGGGGGGGGRCTETVGCKFNMTWCTFELLYFNYLHYFNLILK